MNPTCICGSSFFLRLSIIAIGVAFNSCCSRSPCWKNSSATSKAVWKEARKKRLPAYNWCPGHLGLQISTIIGLLLKELLPFSVHSKVLWLLKDHMQSSSWLYDVKTMEKKSKFGTKESEVQTKTHLRSSLFSAVDQSSYSASAFLKNSPLFLQWKQLSNHTFATALHYSVWKAEQS